MRYGGLGGCGAGDVSPLLVMAHAGSLAALRAILTVAKEALVLRDPPRHVRRWLLRQLWCWTSPSGTTHQTNPMRARTSRRQNYENADITKVTRFESPRESHGEEDGLQHWLLRDWLSSRDMAVRTFQRHSGTTRTLARGMTFQRSSRRATRPKFPRLLVGMLRDISSRQEPCFLSISSTQPLPPRTRPTAPKQNH
jgi:hypothetical protein